MKNNGFKTMICYRDFWRGPEGNLAIMDSKNQGNFAFLVVLGKVLGDVGGILVDFWGIFSAILRDFQLFYVILQHLRYFALFCLIFGFHD